MQVLIENYRLCLNRFCFQTKNDIEKMFWLGSWQEFSVLVTHIFGSMKMVHTKKRDKKIPEGIYGER